MAQACERHLDKKWEHIETCSNFHRNTTCFYVYQMCHNVAQILILD